MISARSARILLPYRVVKEEDETNRGLFLSLLMLMIELHFLTVCLLKVQALSLQNSAFYFQKLELGQNESLCPGWLKLSQPVLSVLVLSPVNFLKVMAFKGPWLLCVFKFLFHRPVLCKWVVMLHARDEFQAVFKKTSKTLSISTLLFVRALWLQLSNAFHSLTSSLAKAAFQLAGLRAEICGFSVISKPSVWNLPWLKAAGMHCFKEMLM